MVGLPDVKGREQILRVHCRKVPTTDNVDVSVIARSTPGFSGADLANIVTNGKDKMPSYKKSLKPDQIKDLVGYIRSLAAK